MTDNAALLQSIQTINDITMKANNSCDQDSMMERQKSDLKTNETRKVQRSHP